MYDEVGQLAFADLRRHLEGRTGVTIYENSGGNDGAEIWLDDGRQVWIHETGAIELVRGEAGQVHFIEPDGESDDDRQRPMRRAKADPIGFAQDLWDDYEGVGDDEE